MRTLSDYLELSEADAAVQWRRIATRVPRPRQESFLPVEIVLSFGLFFVVNPHSYGGANMHKAPPEVHQLATLFTRSPGSLTSKMLNLDGSRKNSGRLEPEVYLRFSSDLDLFLTLYRRVVAAARAVGIAEDRLPDFLGIAVDTPLMMLGQNEIGDSEIGVLLTEHRALVERMMKDFDFTEGESTRIVEQRARLGQHRFARQVLANYGYRCAFCGFAPHSLPNSHLLLASHIKPWRVSSNRERLNPRNGVAACPIHDSAFDSGLLTVNGGYRIHRAEPLDASLAADEGTSTYFAEPVLRSRLIVPDSGAPMRKYLDYHRDHIFRNRVGQGTQAG